MAYARVQPPLVLSLLPASECGAYRSWFNPFKQREINVSVDTFCKIERFRHRRHICFYVRKKKKRKKRVVTYLYLVPPSYSLSLFSYTLSRSKNVVYRTRYRTPLIPWQWFERREERYSKDRSTGGNPFSSPGMIDRARFRAILVSPRRDSRGWIPVIFSWNGTSMVITHAWYFDTVLYTCVVFRSVFFSSDY